MVVVSTVRLEKSENGEICKRYVDVVSYSYQANEGVFIVKNSLSAGVISNTAVYGRAYLTSK
jgi:hypothetical protein